MTRLKLNKNKYGNHAVWVNGRRFDSKHEAERYSELLILEMSGLISHLECQKKFVLLEKQTYEGGTESPITYVADFVYKEDGKVVVEDAKSEITRRLPAYIMKRKMMLKYYGIHIREV